jgi:hypothetical protein
MSALATSAPPTQEQQHQIYNNTSHLYQPAALHSALLPHQTLYQHLASASPTRTALGETCINTNQTPPSTTDNDEYFSQENNGLLKAKLAQRRKHREDIAVERHIGRRGKYNRSTPALEASQDSENKGTNMPVPYSEYRTRCREKQRAEASTGPWDEEMEAAFMEGLSNPLHVF